jgi:NADPH2:quinone reductase
MSTMKAVVVVRPGDPEVLRISEVERPAPGPEEILVAVRASGVNRADLLQRRGRYPAPEGWPEQIPGLEIAGEVVEAGPGCRLFAPADRVMAVVGGGGYAEYVSLHERSAVRAPGGLDWQGAGAVPEAFMTAFDALFLQAGLSAGEVVLVHAVGSGVGTAALQLAGAAGVRTIGTSRTPEKLRRARALGLDVGIVGDERWPRAVLEATGGRGVDVVLDLVGGAYAPGNLQALAGGGRWMVVGVPGGTSAEVDLRRLMGKRASVTGTVLRARPLEEKITLARAFERRVVPVFESGVLRPVVDRTYPAAEAADAHRRMEANLNFGAIVLTWD